jgi:hypothetical protein
MKLILDTKASIANYILTTIPYKNDLDRKKFKKSYTTFVKDDEWKWNHISLFEADIKRLKEILEDVKKEEDVIIYKGLTR